MGIGLGIAIDRMPPRAAGGAPAPPDSANLQLLAVPGGPFFQDSARSTPAALADLTGSWTDTLVGARHIAGSGTTRPIRRAGGLSFAEDNVADVLVSTASALVAGWSIYVRCDVTTNADGILATSSPTTASEPLINTYTTQIFGSTNLGFQVVCADPGGDLVRGLVHDGTNLTVFAGSTEATAAASAQAIAALSIGSTLAGYHKGLVRAVALYRGGHDLTTRNAVRAYLMGL